MVALPENLVDEAPERNAVYFLFDGEELVYIGKSIYPGPRVWSHWTEKVKKFDTVSYLPTPRDELYAVERHWIRKLKPRYNIHNTGRYRPTRLKADLVVKLKVIEAARMMDGEPFRVEEYLDGLVRKSIVADFRLARSAIANSALGD